MNLAYITNVRLPTKKAHGIQTMNMCEAFAHADVSVTLYAPRRLNTEKEAPFLFYGVTRNFRIRKIPCLDVFFAEKILGRIVYWVQLITFFLFSFFTFLFKSRNTVVYTREPLFTLFSWIGFYVVYEAHTIPESKHGSFFFLARQADQVVTISQGLFDVFVKNGFPRKKVFVAHDGIALDRHTCAQECDAVRHSFGIPTEGKIVLYTGLFDDWKGYKTLLKSSLQFPNNTHLVMAGGTSAQVEKLSREYEKVIFLGYISQGDIPCLQKCADVCVVPNSGKTKMSKYYTSPLKVFSYMASGKAIVATRIPSLQEVLNDDNAYFAEPDNIDSLAKAIKEALNDRSADEKGRRARREVEDYTWKKRAQNIISFLYT